MLLLLHGSHHSFTDFGVGLRGLCFRDSSSGWFLKPRIKRRRGALCLPLIISHHISFQHLVPWQLWCPSPFCVSSKHSSVPKLSKKWCNDRRIGQSRFRNYQGGALHWLECAERSVGTCKVILDSVWRHPLWPLLKGVLQRCNILMVDCGVKVKGYHTADICFSYRYTMFIF